MNIGRLQNTYKVPLMVIQIIATIAVILMLKPTLSNIIKQSNVAPTNIDFMAFYCGAAVVLEHADPYAQTPIKICETKILLPSKGFIRSTDINPDPMPGYGIAFFAPLAKLPYRVATVVWDTILLASMVGSAILLASIIEIPFIIILALLTFLDGVMSIGLGQIPPLFTFGIVLAAYGLVKRRAVLVIVGTALGMLEPHLGLPVLATLFVWCAELRLALIFLVLILAEVSIALLGIPINLEYVSIVLPAHTQSEATTSIQYSLTWLLHYFGMADNVAIKIASIQYAIFALISVVGAGFIARKFNTLAVLALLPPAVVLIGGPYIHLFQMVAAIPFALLISMRLRGHAMALVWFAIALLALYWPLWSLITVVEASTIIVMILLLIIQNKRKRIIASIALASIILYVVIAGPIMQHIVPITPQRILSTVPVIMPRTVSGDKLAEQEDMNEEQKDNMFAISTPRTLAVKLPTWFALLIIVGVTFGTREKSLAWAKD